MITLYAVRHGETTYNREDRVQGTKDSRLTEFGLTQADAAAQYFEKMKVDRIFTSPLQRAFNTAERIAAKAGITDIGVIDDFRELHCGIFEDQLIEDIKKTNWDAWQEFLGDPAIAPEGGESMNQLYHRTSKAVTNILSTAGEDETVVLVSHAGTVRMTLAYLMDISVKSAVNFGLSNGSIARFINKYDRWTCLKWNDTEHLGALEGEVKFVL